MTDTSEEELLAKLYYSIDGKKPKKNSWVYLAERLNELKNLYGSRSAVAQKLNLHNETVREILKVLDLSTYVQSLLNEKRIAYDAAWRLASVKDKQLQNSIANAIIGLNAHDARAVVRFARSHPKENMEDYAKKLLESKGTVKELKLIINALNEHEYNALKIASQKRKMSISELSSKIISEWLKKEVKK